MSELAGTWPTGLTLLRMSGRGALSPPLFNRYIDSCIKKLAEDECGTRIGSTQVSCLMYADDAVLLAPDDIHLQSIVMRISEVCLEKDLRMNADKCKLKVFEKSGCKTT